MSFVFYTNCCRVVRRQLCDGSCAKNIKNIKKNQIILYN